MYDAQNTLWFFAICLSAETQCQVAMLYDRICDNWTLDRRRPLNTSRLHITLFPLGSFISGPQRAVSAAQEAAGSIAFSAFEVCLDRAITRHGTHLALTADTPCGALFSFQQKLYMAMRLAGVRPRRDWKFDPHITLRYSEHTLVDQQIAPISWTVSEFTLIESLQGKTVHNHLHKWPLSQAA